MNLLRNILHLASSVILRQNNWRTYMKMTLKLHWRLVHILLPVFYTFNRRRKYICDWLKWKVHKLVTFFVSQIFIELKKWQETPSFFTENCHFCVMMTFWFLPFHPLYKKWEAIVLLYMHNSIQKLAHIKILCYIRKDVKNLFMRITWISVKMNPIIVIRLRC